MDTPSGSVSNLSYFRLAEITARLDAGEPRSEILGELGVKDEELHEAQRTWLASLGEEVLRGNFEMQRLCAKEYAHHLEMARAILGISDDEEPARGFPIGPPPQVVQPPAAIGGVPLPSAVSQGGRRVSPPSDDEPPLVQRPAPSAHGFAEPPVIPVPLVQAPSERNHANSGASFAEPPLATPAPIARSSSPAEPPVPVAGRGGSSSSNPPLVPHPPLVEPPSVSEPSFVNEPPVVLPPAVLPPIAAVPPPTVAAPIPPQPPLPAEPPQAVRSKPSEVLPPVRARRLPPQMGGTVSFSEPGFQIPGLGGNVGTSPSAGSPAAQAPNPVARPALPRDEAFSPEPPAVPAAASPESSGVLPSGFGQRRAPSVKPLPERLDFMTGGAGGGNQPAAATPAWTPAPVPVPAAAGLPPPPVAIPSPMGALSPGGHPWGPPPVGGAPAASWANPGAPPAASPSPGFGGTPSHAVASPAGSVTQLSMEQLACIQAELDVDPQRLEAVVAANGIDSESYQAQAERLRGELTDDPAKGQRFDQLREYYRAILGTP